MSGPCLPCGLTPEQVIEGMGELATLGLDALGQPLLAALVPVAVKLAEDGARLIEGPTAAQVLATEVDAEQAGADTAEALKFKEP